jgi:hypothetical protein
LTPIHKLISHHLCTCHLCQFNIRVQDLPKYSDSHSKAISQQVH